MPFGEERGKPRQLGYLSGAPRVSTRPDSSASGPRAHVLGVIKGFRALGWQVKPYIFGDIIPRRLRAEEVDVWMAQGYLQRLVSDVARFGMGIANAGVAPLVVGRVDWAYERFASFQALGYAFQIRGIPWILESNGLLFAEATEDRASIALVGVERTLELWAYRQADVLVVVSPTLKDLIASHGVDPRKIVVVPNGVDVDLFRPLPKGEGGEERKGCVIGFVGTLYRWQGLDLLIQAMAELRAEGIDLELIVVGDGLMRRPWQELSRALGLAEKVAFVGRVPWQEIPSWIARFDLGYSGQIPLSVKEMYHSPLKLYEYMAMGKPVIASAYEDARGLVGKDERGFLFEPGSLEDLKRALRKACAARDSWESMGRAARRFIEKEHSWEARVKYLVEQASAILEHRRRT